MLENYDRSGATPPPQMSYASSQGLLALHNSMYPGATRSYDVDSSMDGNDGSMSMDPQIISVSIFYFTKKMSLFNLNFLRQSS